MAMFHGNVRGEVRVNFLALFASKPHIFMCGALKLSGIVRAGFRQNGFFADFDFRAAGFFRGFSRRIFPHFCGKKCPEKSSRKIPWKILQNLYYKHPPTHFRRLARARTVRTNVRLNIAIPMLFCSKSIEEYSGRSAGKGVGMEQQHLLASIPFFSSRKRHININFFVRLLLGRPRV